MVGILNFENKELFYQIDAVEKMLEDAGFDVETVSSRFGYVNWFYSKEGCDTVFCTIYNKKGSLVFYTIFDKSIREIRIPKGSIFIDVTTHLNQRCLITKNPKGYINDVKIYAPIVVNGSLQPIEYCNTVNTCNINIFNFCISW